VDSISIEKGLEASSQQVREAIIEELKQLEEIGAYIPTFKRNATTRIIPSKMIAKSKYVVVDIDK
jgi:hypothetical protein